LEKPVGPTMNVDDLRSVRKALQQGPGRNFGNPADQDAARLAVNKIDDYLRGGVDPNHVIKGDPAAVAARLKEADRNYAPAKRAELIEGKTAEAIRDAEAANSGQNVENKIRQKINAIRKNPKLMQGMSQNSIDAMDKLSRGTNSANVLRAIGNLLGGGGGLGTIAAEVGGESLFGHTGLATPAIGFVAKKLGNFLTERQADKLSELIRSEAPESQKWAALANAHAKAAGLNPPQAALLRSVYTYPSLRSRLLSDPEQKRDQE